MTQHISPENLYGNCKVFNKEGELIFRCDNKKAKWYLDRNLASIISYDPLSIKFNFKAKGRGHAGDDFYLTARVNHCVVCGNQEKLTRHHIVPICYRKHFPEHTKRHSSHDIVMLCVSCHIAYEEEAFELKKKIGEEFGIPVEGFPCSINQEILRIRGAANTLLKYSDVMPQERIELLSANIKKYLGKNSLNKEDLEKTSKFDFKNGNYVHHGKYVVEHLDDLQSFVNRWRFHFLEKMKPTKMPEGWVPDRNIVRGEQNAT